MSAPLLSVQGVRKAFGGIVVLDDLTFEVPAGGITAIIGPNGAGKSTLFNVLAGVYAPDRGSILFAGASLLHTPAHRMAGIGLVRTFQGPPTFGNMTVLENVAVGRHTRSRCGFLEAALRLPRARREERAIHAAAWRALEQVGLAAQASLPSLALSAGQQRLLGIARALACEPRLLLLDEPAAGLSGAETVRLASLIRRLVREDGVVVLLVEHDMRLVMTLAERVLVLDAGRKLADGTPAEVRCDARVVKAYLGGGDSLC